MCCSFQIVRVAPIEHKKAQGKCNAIEIKSHNVFSTPFSSSSPGSPENKQKQNERKMNKNKQEKKGRRRCSVPKCYIIIDFLEKMLGGALPQAAEPCCAPPGPFSLFVAIFGVAGIGAQLCFAVRAGHPPDADVIPVTNYPIEIHASLVQDVENNNHPTPPRQRVPRDAPRGAGHDAWLGDTVLPLSLAAGES